MAGYLGLIRYSVSILKEYLGITWNNLSFEYIGLATLIKNYILFDFIQTIRV